MIPFTKFLESSALANTKWQCIKPIGFKDGTEIKPGDTVEVTMVRPHPIDKEISVSFRIPRPNAKDLVYIGEPIRGTDFKTGDFVILTHNVGIFHSGDRGFLGFGASRANVYVSWEELLQLGVSPENIEYEVNNLIRFRSEQPEDRKTKTTAQIHGTFVKFFQVINEHGRSEDRVLKNFIQKIETAPEALVQMRQKVADRINANHRWMSFGLGFAMFQEHFKRVG